MAKVIPSRNVGVPANNQPDHVNVVLYFGPAGFTPRYDQTERVELPISGLPRTERDGQDLFVVSTDVLPPVDGDYDLYFTFEDDAHPTEGNETDFSPKITVPLDRDPGPAPLQPVLL